MADERLLITIEGKDGVSKTFVAVGQSADAAGKSVEKAGKTGATAMKGLADETKRTAASADELERRYTKIGATIGTALGVVSKLGASYRDQRLDLQSLEAQYGSASDTVIAFTETIQDSMNQSNDAARDSALVFATLFRNYEMGEQQIIDLMTRTTDIAAARGRSLTETSQMVQNALRGEAEYIEQIGVTLNDTYVASEYAARGLGNWNTLTDEAAKAQFRYVLLMEQTADTQGRAAEEAARAGGLMRRFINETQDAGQTIGGFLGPAGEMAAEFSQIAIGLPVIAGGFGKLIGTVQNSARAMSLLSLATGPVGIGLAAIATVGAMVWASFREGDAEAEALVQTLTDLDMTIEMLRRRGEGDLAALGEEFKATVAAFQDVSLSIDEMSDAQAISLAQQLSGIRMEAEAARAWLKDFNPEIEIKFAVSDADLAAINRKVDEALNDPNVDAEAFIEWANGVLEAAAATETLADDAVALQTILEKPLSDFSINQYTESVTGLGAAFRLVQEEADGFLQKILHINDVAEDDSFLQKFLKTLGLNASDRAAVNETLGAFEDIFTIGENMPGPGASHQEWMDWVNEMERGTYAWRRRVAVANQAMAENAVVTEEAAEATKEATVAQAQLAEEMANVEAAAERQAAGWETLSQAVEAYNSRVLDNLNQLMEIAGYGDPLSRWNLSGNATQASIMADNLNDAATALDTVFRVTVGNTNAIASQADSVMKWADELIGVSGEYGKIDDLLANGLITQEQYNAAQQSYNSIAQDTASIQEYTLKIQAMQAPLVADQTAALENQLEIISNLPAEQQLIALGWMDATTAARAMEFQTLAVAAANGELGANGEEAFTAMITGAAQADPVLKALLIDMGLISEGADGTITVNFGSVEGAKSEIALLTDSINMLIITLGGVPPLHIEDNTAEVIGNIGEVETELTGLDGATATLNLYLNDQANNPLKSAYDQITALDGKTATTTIRTVYDTIGSPLPGGVGPGLASGGVVGYAGGGVIAELAEAGPEIVHFASGGSAWAGQRGIYNLSPGDFVMPHNAIAGNSYGGVTIDFSGAVFHNTSREEMNRWAKEDFIPAIERGTSRQRRQLGVS